MKRQSQKKQPAIVIGVIGADCHAVGNKIIEVFFTEKGYKVINLGVMVDRDEFISAAIESDARAILISSLYGHAEIDCAGFRDACIERGLDNIILYVGGNLHVGKIPFDEIEKKFRGMGFDRVFPADIDLGNAEKLLKHDIESQ